MKTNMTESGVSSTGAAAEVALYSRDLKNVTGSFPRSALRAAALAADVMLDGEILAFRDGRVMPFHALQTRLGRVAPDAGLMAAVPVIYVAWDLLVAGDDVLLDRPLRERRDRLEALVGPASACARAPRARAWRG